MFKNDLVIIFILIISSVQFTSTATIIECEDDKILGIDELVVSVSNTLEECNRDTKSKLDFFGCFFKRLDLSQFKDEGKVSAKKVFRFLKGILSSRIFKEVKDFAVRVTACAATYATARVAEPVDAVGVGSGVLFLKCFYDALRKFNVDVHENCNAMMKKRILMMTPTTTTSSPTL